MKKSDKASSIKRNDKTSITTLAKYFYNFYNLFLTLHSSPLTLLYSSRTYKPSIEII
jgi:hypothetical protein